LDVGCAWSTWASATGEKLSDEVLCALALSSAGGGVNSTVSATAASTQVTIVPTVRTFLVSVNIPMSAHPLRTNLLASTSDYPILLCRHSSNLPREVKASLSRYPNFREPQPCRQLREQDERIAARLALTPGRALPRGSRARKLSSGCLASAQLCNRNHAGTTPLVRRGANRRESSVLISWVHRC
jgi:hypothetical protein